MKVSVWIKAILLPPVITMAVGMVILLVSISTFGAIQCYEPGNCSEYEKILATIMAVMYIVLNLASLYSLGHEPEVQLTSMIFTLVVPAVSFLGCIIGLYGWALMSSVVTGDSAPAFLNFPIEGHWKMGLKILGFYASIGGILSIIIGLLAGTMILVGANKKREEGNINK